MLILGHGSIGREVARCLSPFHAEVIGVGRDRLGELPRLLPRADALVAELRSGRLRAALDVVGPEPLPDGHPLWELALAITPHHAGDSAQAEARAVQLAAEQLGRYVRGEELTNVVLAPGR